MSEDAQEIFKYLPIQSGDETLYIRHLYGSFETLYDAGDPVKPFAILPFHLLFILAVQYKVYRISAWDNDAYQEALKDCRIYGDDSQLLKENAPIPNKNGSMPSRSSVRNLSLIQESHLSNFFELKPPVIAKMSKLIYTRGTYAHANGNIEKNIDERIDEYLGVLKEIQSYMKAVNVGIQDWGDQIDIGEFPLAGFFKKRFLSSQFSPYDFGDIVGSLFESPNLDFEQWNEIADMGLGFAHDQTVNALRTSALNNTDLGQRFNAIRVLSENDELDIDLKNQIRQNETASDILALLQ